MGSDMNLEETNDVTAATQDVLAHHLECFGKLDLAGTMADYTDASRFFTPDGLLRGSEAIRRFFAVMFEEFEKPGMSFELLRQ
jgi:ketosteroid isomerase-like protein